MEHALARHQQESRCCFAAKHHGMVHAEPRNLSLRPHDGDTHAKLAFYFWRCLPFWCRHPSWCCQPSWCCLPSWCCQPSWCCRPSWYWPKTRCSFCRALQIFSSSRGNLPTCPARARQAPVSMHSQRVRHFAYTAWPDHGVPGTVRELLMQRSAVRDYYTGKAARTGGVVRAEIKISPPVRGGAAWRGAAHPHEARDRPGGTGA